ncbi:RnfH family protein [Ramlibacter sp. AN1133]|uniref:RnfH family protein n=1 Tax=Ramlibacter sp. AN1133 TaxID=3133429 RepID=UPI0030C4A5A8
MPRVIVCWSPSAREVLEWPLELPGGATVADAVRASGFAAAAGGRAPGEGELGVWGRRCGPQQPLHEGDRVEIYRLLRVDPKVARRERFRQQGARAAGLFAQRRPGGKPGY